MNISNAKVIGVYRIPYTKELYDIAFQKKYGGIPISFWRKMKIRKLLLEELSSIVLVEAMIDNSDKKFDIGDFHQPNSDQVPYDEVYLDEEGEKIIARCFEMPSSDTLRVAFFLHYFDPTQPINISNGEIVCPKICGIPDRLKNIIRYEPVD